MDIILVSDRLAKARTITVRAPHLALTVLALITAIAALTTALSHTLLRYGTEYRLPFVQRVLSAMQQEETARGESHLRESLNAMAVRVGQMQAQLLRLDTGGERLAKLAGCKPQELMFGQPAGQGGAG